MITLNIKSSNPKVIDTGVIQILKTPTYCNGRRTGETTYENSNRNKNCLFQVQVKNKPNATIQMIFNEDWKINNKKRLLHCKVEPVPDHKRLLLINDHDNETIRKKVASLKAQFDSQNIIPVYKDGNIITQNEREASFYQQSTLVDSLFEQPEWCPHLLSTKGFYLIKERDRLYITHTSCDYKEPLERLKQKQQEQDSLWFNKITRYASPLLTYFRPCDISNLLKESHSRHHNTNSSLQTSARANNSDSKKEVCEENKFLVYQKNDGSYVTAPVYYPMPANGETPTGSEPVKEVITVINTDSSTKPNMLDQDYLWQLGSLLPNLKNSLSGMLKETGSHHNSACLDSIHSLIGKALGILQKYPEPTIYETPTLSENDSKALKALLAQIRAVMDNYKLHQLHRLFMPESNAVDALSEQDLAQLTTGTDYLAEINKVLLTPLKDTFFANDPHGQNLIYLIDNSHAPHRFVPSPEKKPLKRSYSDEDIAGMKTKLARWH